MSQGDELRGLLGSATDPRQRALLVEAARIADRLDDLNEIIAGRGVLQLLRFRLVDDEGRVAEVKFDHVLSEARQQAVALRSLLQSLGVERVTGAAPESDGGGGLLASISAIGSAAAPGAA